MTEGIVFDLDDTLIWERDYVRSGFQAVDAALVASGAVGLAPGQALGLLWTDFENGVRGNQFDRLLRAMPEAAAAMAVADLVHVYRSHMPNLSLDPERRALLVALRARARLGVITDGPLASQTAKAERIGIAALVDVVVFSDTWGRDFWKPSPRPFEEMALALDLPHDRLTYVGDNPLKDFVAARRLGWRTIRLRHPSQLRAGIEPPDPTFAADAEVDGIGALAALLGVSVEDAGPARV